MLERGCSMFDGDGFKSISKRDGIGKCNSKFGLEVSLQKSRRKACLLILFRLSNLHLSHNCARKDAINSTLCTKRLSSKWKLI